MPEDRETGRKLRPKERKVYTDETEDDEIEGGRRTFNVEEKLKSPKFSNQKMLKLLNGSDVTVKYFQENGFKYPILIKTKEGLGIRVPGENFTVTDVKQCVGSRRNVDVMDVNTQKAVEMTMKEWVGYYLNKERDRLLNVISLEFSHTRLENYVEQPMVVKQLDWVDTVWPTYLKDCQTEATNIIEKMKYPKVQKYCLMSVAGCYTDFHIDMGGTSVWYHLLHGSKVFWLIPPTEENLDLFEKWVKSGRQGDIFFGDKVKECCRIHLVKGNTFFIPTGWIHAVFTPEDSLVFGGNFLHSINIDMQLNIWEIESRTHVPSKFRYPFFTEIHWYVLDRYLSCVQGKSYRIKSSEEIKADKEDEEYDEDVKVKVKAEDLERPDLTDVKLEDDVSMDYTPPRTPADDDASSVASTRGTSSRPGTPDSRTSRQGRGSARSSKSKLLAQSDLDRIRPVSVKLQNCMLMDKNKLMATTSSEKKAWVHLTPYEIQGLQTTVEWCEKLPPTKKLVPKDISDPDALLMDMKQLIKDHMADNPHESLTGDLAIKWPVRKKPKVKVRTYTTSFPRPKTPKSSTKSSSGSGAIRRRRVRCKKCEPCTRTDCEMCSFCKDMKKFGGPGRMKQSCISRQCIRPELPSVIHCILCGAADNKDAAEDSADGEIPMDTLLECGICWEIVHPRCLAAKNLSLTAEGILNEDLPNSWECIKCVDEGKHGLIRPRQIKGTLKEHQEFHTPILGNSATNKKLSPASSVGDSDTENRKCPPTRTQNSNSSRRNSVSSLKEVASPDCNGNGVHETTKNDNTTKNGNKRHRSFWDDFEVTSPQPRKMLKVEISPLKKYKSSSPPPSPKVTSAAELLLSCESLPGTPLSTDSSMNLILTVDSSPPSTPREPDLPGKIFMSSSSSSSSSSLQSSKRDPPPAKTHRREPSPKKPHTRHSSTNRQHRRDPSPHKSRRRDPSARRARSHGRSPRRDPSPLKSPRGRSPSPCKSPLSSPRLTSRGREINLPSRFL